MTSSAGSSVTIQTSSRSVPAMQTWFGEVALLVHQSRHERRVFDAKSRAGALCLPLLWALR